MGKYGGGSKAVPGRQYVTHDGETFEDVGVNATGKAGQGALIALANPHVSGKTKLPKGTVLVIPGEAPALKLTGKAQDDLTCVIGGRVVPLLNARIMRSMDTGTDGWSGRIAWTPGADKELDRLTRPFGYERAAVYIGNSLVVGGCLYCVEPEMTTEGSCKGLTGYSFTADAIDSCVMPPYEINGLTLKQIADYYCKPLGIKAVFDVTVKDDKDFMAPFKRVTAQETEHIFDHLAKLASQRGGLLGNTVEGDMLFLRAKTEGQPVGTLREGGPFAPGWKAKYDGRQRWHGYKCITAGVKGREVAGNRLAALLNGAQPSSGKQLPSTVTEIDSDVPRSRFVTFHADDVTPGNVLDAAKWKRNRHFADALTIPFPVTGWYAPNGTLWDVNTLVTVVSPTLSVPQGFTFLIRSVEFELESNRRTATLHLTPPEAFSGRQLKNIWKW